MAIFEAHGSVSMRINSKDFANITADGTGISVTFTNPGYLKELAGKAPHQMKRITFLRHLSAFMFHMGLTLMVNDERGEIVSMGKGIHGILGHLKVSLLRARKYV